MKVGKTNFRGTGNYVTHIINLNQALTHGQFR